MTTPDDLRPWFLFFRDVTCFVAGLSLFIWDSQSGGASPTWIPAYFGLMGLPAVLRVGLKKADE